MHEIIEGLLRRGKLDQNVDVALVFGFITHKRAKDTTAPDTKAAEVWLMLVEKSEDLFFGLHSHHIPHLAFPSADDYSTLVFGKRETSEAIVTVLSVEPPILTWV